MRMTLGGFGANGLVRSAINRSIPAIVAILNATDLNGTSIADSAIAETGLGASFDFANGSAAFDSAGSPIADFNLGARAHTLLNDTGNISVDAFQSLVLNTTSAHNVSTAPSETSKSTDGTGLASYDVANVSAESSVGGSGSGSGFLELRQTFGSLRHVVQRAGMTTTASFDALKRSVQKAVGSNSVLMVVASSSAAGGLLYFVGHPAELCVVVLFVSCLISIIRNQSGFSGQRVKMKEVRARQEILQRNYHESVKAMQELLGGMSESAASFASSNFAGKVRAFESFLKYVEREPHRFGTLESFLAQTSGNQHGDEEFLAEFRIFVRIWLHVFQQCTLDPVNHPRVIVSNAQLDRCKTVVDICHVVHHGLQSHKVDFVKEQIAIWEKSLCLSASHGNHSSAHAGAAGSECHSHWIQVACVGCGVRAGRRTKRKAPGHKEETFPFDVLMGCCKITIFSAFHSSVMVALLLASGLFALEVAMANYAFAFVAVCTVVAAVHMLSHLQEFDNLAQLEDQVAELEQGAEDVETTRRVMHDFFDKMHRLTDLWRYGTAPRLEMLKELHEQLRDTPDEAKLHFLRSINRKLQALNVCMGDIQFWCGDDAVEEEMLEVVANQLRACCNYISTARSDSSKDREEIVWRLGNSLGFLVVRVVSGTDLTNKGHLHNSNAFCNIEIGTGDSVRKTLTTTVMENNLNPVWNEEFFVPLEPQDNDLVLHLWHNSKALEASSLGFVRTPIRTLAPGVWRRFKERLWSNRTGKYRTHGALEFEMYYANEVHQLKWRHENSAQADMDVQTFVSGGLSVNEYIGGVSS